MALHQADFQFTAGGSGRAGREHDEQHDDHDAADVRILLFLPAVPRSVSTGVVQGAFQLVQQLIVNAHMNKIDVDDLIRRNVEKMNKKRARKGLPPANVSEKASVNLKALQAREDAESKAKEDKISRNKKQMEASEAFYNSDPKPGSLASKAKMVQKYNDKHAKNRRRAQDGYDYGYR